MVLFRCEDNAAIKRWQTTHCKYGLCTNELMEKAAKKFNVRIHLYTPASIHGGKTILFYKEVNSEGERQIALLTKRNNLCAWAWILPDKRKTKKEALGILGLNQCDTCSLWRSRTNFQKHIKECVKCRCGTIYKEGELHGLNCAGLSKSDKKKYLAKTNTPKVYLKAPEKQCNTNNCYFADIETFVPPDGNSVPYSIALNRPLDDNDDDCMVFSGPDCIKDFFDEMISHQGVLWFHNGARYDAYFMLKHCLEYGIPIDETSILKKGSTIISFKFITLRGFMEVKDTCRFTQGTLLANCKAYGIKSDLFKGDFDHNKIRNWEDVQTHKEEYEIYVKKDVMAMRAVFLAYSKVVWDQFHIHANQFMTGSHLAYAAWISDQPNLTLDLIRIKAEDEPEVRKFYRGGRIIVGRPAWTSEQYDPEQFKEGENESGERGHFVSRDYYDAITDYAVYGDVNSLYPSVMTKRQFPVGDYKRRKVSPRKQIKLLRMLKRQNEHDQKYWHRTAAKVSCTCPKDLMIAFLMERTEECEVSQTLFDKVEVWYTGPELLEAVLLGYEITAIHEVIVWEKLKEIFTDYIEAAYKRKTECKPNLKTGDEGNPPVYACNKSWMNDLSGKFGQESSLETCRVVRDLATYQGINAQETTVVEDKDGRPLAWVVTETKEHEQSDYPIQLSCFILGWSKVSMSKILREAGLLQDAALSILYSDTDSYIMNIKAWEKIPKEMKSGSVLGGIKLEVNGKIIHGVFLAPKTYMIVYIDANTLEIKARFRGKGIPHIGHDYPAFVIETHAEQLKRNSKIPEEAPNGVEPIDIKDRQYHFKQVDSDEVENLSRIPAHYFHDILLGNRTMSVKFGSIERTFDYSNTERIKLRNCYKKRTLMKTNWWDKGKRILVKDEEGKTFIDHPAYPPGHVKAVLIN
jgi:hypothetical protein